MSTMPTGTKMRNTRYKCCVDHHRKHHIMIPCNAGAVIGGAQEPYSTAHAAGEYKAVIGNSGKNEVTSRKGKAGYSFNRNHVGRND